MAQSKKPVVRKPKEIPTPPDGGYGWIVLASSFMISFIVDGVMYSFGLVLQQIKLQFQVEDSISNWLSSLYTGFLFCSGPIVAGLSNEFGCRVVIMGGAVVTSLVYVATAFSPSIYIQMFVFGFIGGISHGCTYIASLIIIAEYFDKKRGFATGITMAGSGVGAFAFAPFLQTLIKKYDWKFTMIIMACLFLQCAVLGCLLRPLKVTKSNKKEVEMIEVGRRKSSIIQDPLATYTSSLEAMKPIQTFSGSILSIDTIHLHDENSSGCSSNTFCIIAKDIIREMTNFSLLKTNKNFLLITISNLCVFLGYFVPFLYIPMVGDKLEIPNHPLLLSIIGLLNIPFRMLFGFMADKNIVSPINLNTISIVIATAPFFFYILLTTFNTQIIFSVLFAIGISGMNSLTTSYLVQLVGMRDFSIATGIVSLFRGFGCFCGAPIAGAIASKMGMYGAFYYSGIMFAAGFVFSFFISFAKIIQSLFCKKKSASLSSCPDIYLPNEIMFDNQVHDININDPSKLNVDQKNSTGLRALIRAAMLSNEATFNYASDPTTPLVLRHCQGSDVDIALLKCCEAIYPNMAHYREQNRKVYAIPSSRMNAYQLFVYQTDDQDERFLVVLKCTFEMMLQQCTTMFIDGEDVEIDSERTAKLHRMYKELNNASDRVICLCDTRLDPTQYPADFQFDQDEILSFSNLRFIGIITLANAQTLLKEIA